MSAATTGKDPYYYIPQPSHWPITGSCALLLMAAGAAGWINAYAAGPWLLAAGFAVLVYMLFGWFGTVIGESERALYNQKVDLSFRWAMSWFIFSEVMFFAAFFGALFYVRVISVPDLGSLLQKGLWPDFTAQWPTDGPYFDYKYSTIPAFGIPLLNTILLLSSGVTITIAHHALKASQRGKTALFMFLTIALGVAFLGFQAFEYVHGYTELNLKLSTGVYGSTFYMLTGFHGLHVTLGATMLIVILARILKGHFTPDRHFGFEAVAWYWHFVDVVWLLLFVLVYWL